GFGVGKKHTGFHLLIEPVMFLIAQEADHLKPIFGPGVSNALANRASIAPEILCERLVNQDHKRRIRLAIPLLKSAAVEQRHADCLDIARRSCDTQHDWIVVLRSQPSSLRLELTAPLPPKRRRRRSSGEADTWQAP